MPPLPFSPRRRPGTGQKAGTERAGPRRPAGGTVREGASAGGVGLGWRCGCSRTAQGGVPGSGIAPDPAAATHESIGKGAGAREASARSERAGGGSCRVGGARAWALETGKQVGDISPWKLLLSRPASRILPSWPTHWRGRCQPGRGTCRWRRTQAQAQGRVTSRCLLNNSSSSSSSAPPRAHCAASLHSVLTACTRWRPPARWPVEENGRRQRRRGEERLVRRTQQEPSAAVWPIHRAANIPTSQP